MHAVEWVLGWQLAGIIYVLVTHFIIETRDSTHV
jgi:hypothetical protein